MIAGVGSPLAVQMNEAGEPTETVRLTGSEAQYGEAAVKTHHRLCTFFNSKSYLNPMKFIHNAVMILRFLRCRFVLKQEQISLLSKV